MLAIEETGLLEQSLVVIQSPDAVGRRSLLDSTGRPIGHAAWHGSWWRGLLRPTLHVHEEQEAPLVFTLERRLPMIARWLVRDAEGELVGALAGAWILDHWDRPFAWRQDNPMERSGAILTVQGSTPLCHWRWQGADLHLHFTTGAGPDPFLRMLLMATALCQPCSS